MEWIMTILGFLFLIFVSIRIYYIKGYRAGARMVLKEWKAELNGEEKDNEHI